MAKQHILLETGSLQGVLSSIRVMPVPMDCTVESVRVYCGLPNAAGAAIFDLNTGPLTALATIFPDPADRPRILANATEGEVTGLSIDLTEGDWLSVDLDAFPLGGVQGPVFIDLIVEDGTAVQGAPGSVWYNGAGVPAGGLGVNGDYYVRLSNYDLYFKAAGAWSVVGNIKGATGATGAAGPIWRDGAGVPDNAVGVDSDYYLRTSNGDVYKRAAGAYSVVGNIKGPQGNAGATGAAGTPGTVWRTGTVAPSDGVGVDGDYYVNIVTAEIFKRVAGVYFSQGSFKADAISIQGRAIVEMPTSSGASLLADNFNDNALNTAIWTVVSPASATIVREQNNHLEIIPVPNTSAMNYVDTITFDARDRTVSFEFQNILNDPSGQAYSAGVFYGVYYFVPSTTNYVMLQNSVGAWQVIHYIGGVAQGSSATGWNTAPGQKFRFRHVQSTNTLYVEIWNGSVYTALRTITSLGFSVANLFLEFFAGYTVTTNPTSSGRDRLAIDNFDAGGVTYGGSADTLKNNAGLFWNSTTSKFEPKVLTSRLKLTTGAPSGPPDDLPEGYTEQRWNPATRTLYIYNPSAGTWSSQVF